MFRLGCLSSGHVGERRNGRPLFTAKHWLGSFRRFSVWREFYIWVVAVLDTILMKQSGSPIQGAHGFWVWFLLPSVLLQLFQDLFPFIFNLS
ncbi:hypothetical protein GE21DRAFT_1046731 [Neurospora crassa]|nr:hypothetical protein GE21DRAFT_1046731 [Neurospora crassa]